MTHAPLPEAAGTLPQDDSIHARARQEARARATWLGRAAENPDAGTAAEIEQLIDQAERQGWPEVVRSGQWAAVKLAWDGSSDDLLEAVERLRAQADADGNVAMLALALAARASVWIVGGDPLLSAAADADLARATVLLESDEGDPVERAIAHNRCAVTFGERRLWELEDEQYAAREQLTGSDDFLMAGTVLFNRVELQLSWACALREIGDIEGVQERCRAGAAAMAVASRAAMPERWRDELVIIGILLAAVGGVDRSEQARAMLAQGQDARDYTGYLHLAIALAPASVGAGAAARAAEQALATLERGRCPNEYDLALRVAAELEAAAHPGPSAGLRYAQRHVELRWDSRLAALTAMRSLLQSERLRAEHDLLSRHAYLDDLTGLANRRGFHRYIDGLQARGVEQMAMLLVDIDQFKAVNDGYGHGAGDLVLTQLAAILAASVRSGDLAVRLGGDEFALLVADIDLAAARRRADALLVSLAQQPWHQIGSMLQITVSIGVAVDHPRHIDDLAGRADAALYRAKAVGGSRSVWNASGSGSTASDGDGGLSG